MSALPRSPQAFLRPISPHRSPHRSRPSSPTMHTTPGSRRWRTTGSSEDVFLRDLTPTDTLRAFIDGPSVFDTTRDEYKIYACIENLTAAEKELGARVAKAAERLESWCDEIKQWGWSGSFEPPTDDFLEERRRSIALRIQEHTRSANLDEVAPLKYYGSLLAVEVEEHEARLDEISEELAALEYDELKAHILDIHGPRSRPSSAGFGVPQYSNYKPLDDFSFLITQTLIASLPHHFVLKDRLETWAARISVLREVPGYLKELPTAQQAMTRAWDAINPPEDTSDESFEKWKAALDTISHVLQNKLRDLGHRLDRMLDVLEGRIDRIPDEWIDVFEGVEANLQRWSSESRRKIIEFDIWRKRTSSFGMTGILTEHSNHNMGDGEAKASHDGTFIQDFDNTEPRPRSVTAFRGGIPVGVDYAEPLPGIESQPAQPSETSPLDDDSDFEEGDTVLYNAPEETEGSVSTSFDSTSFSSPIILAPEDRSSPDVLMDRPQTPDRPASAASFSSIPSYASSPAISVQDSPTVRKNTSRQSKAPRPELNAIVPKRRAPLKVVEESEIDSSVPWPPKQFSSELSANPPKRQDLDSQIIDILTTIPAAIRLTSREEAEGKKPPRKQTSKGYLRSTRSINGIKSPELTLSPAKDTTATAAGPGGRRSTAANRNDNDIKLYHLNQAGKEKPIKLFIRRVGEQGERVMVRVGGGWADLGEYLRQYAEHHGRRAISEGKFELLGLETKSAEAEGRERPESAMSKRSRRVSNSTTGRSSTTPQKAAGRGILTDDAAPPPMPPNFTGTPLGTTPSASAAGTPLASTAAPTGDVSAPSTDNTTRSWRGDEVGLAGPKAKKSDLDSQKLEWIEGMMKQARSVSNSNLTTTWTPKMDTPTGGTREGAASRPGSRNGARKGASSRPQSRNGPAANANGLGGTLGAPGGPGGGGARRQPSFGDLGKVGGTKRVFMRGGEMVRE